MCFGWGNSESTSKAKKPSFLCKISTFVAQRKGISDNCCKNGRHWCLHIVWFSFDTEIKYSRVHGHLLFTVVIFFEIFPFSQGSYGNLFVHDFSKSQSDVTIKYTRLQYSSFSLHRNVKPVIESVPLEILRTYISLHSPSLSVFHPIIHVQTAIHLLSHTNLLSHIHRSIVYPPTTPSTLTSSHFISPTRSYTYVRTFAHSLAHIRPPII
jgi:hypothetical protein